MMNLTIVFSIDLSECSDVKRRGDIKVISSVGSNNFPDGNERSIVPENAVVPKPETQPAVDSRTAFW